MKKNYLENKLFKLYPLFNINYNIKKNLICASLFKIKELYKSFDKYIDILEKIYHIIDKKYKNYSFRVFIDNTIYNDEKIMKRLKKLSNIELVHYVFLLNINEGLIGTLVRFFPMFNFKNNDANIVLITDVDHFMLFDIKKYFKILKNNEVDINEIYLIKKGNLSQNIQYKGFETVLNNKLNVYSYASHIINIKKINYNIIINYILEVIESKIIYSYFTKFKYNNDTFNKKFELTKPFIYGVDEYFINFTLHNYFINNKLPIISIIKFNITDTYYYLITERNFYQNLNTKQINMLKSILKSILTSLKIIHKTNNIIELYKLLNISINNINRIKFEEICYSIFIILKNNKNNFIYDKCLYKYLLNKYNFGVYTFEEIFFYNYDNKNIILDKKKLNNTFLNKLIKYI
jgi:hypothetical protein